MLKGANLGIKEVTLINEIGKLFSKGLSFNESILELLKILYSFWDVRHSFVALLDKEKKLLSISQSFGLTPEEIKKGIFKVGEGIIGRVYKYGIPVVLSDLKEKTYLNRTGLRDRLEEKETFVAVPIRIGGEIIGVLAIFKKFLDRDSVEKGVDLLQILATMIGMFYKLHERIDLERRDWEEEKRALTQVLEEKYSIEGIVGCSDAIKKLVALIKKVAPTDITVLITGESGTGKSLIAKAIHFLSPRKEKAFITINCSAIPETLLEAELFGYEKGAFSGAYTSKKGKFELSNGGTLFLDEIGDMPLSLQAKLLRVIQEQSFERLGGTETVKVDVRIIAATHRDLEEMIREGLFREDLYYRLNVVPIFLPPLRERPEDIPVLIDYFLEKFNKEYGKAIKFSSGAVKMLLNHDWPGNVRELENLIERIVLLSDKDEVSEEEVSLYLREQKIQEKKGLVKEISELEKERILEALKICNFNQTRAAKLLGLTRRQLGYRIKKYGLKKMNTIS